MMRWCTRSAAVTLAALLLSACGLPDQHTERDELRGLSRQPAVPAGAPRSRVTPIDYELTSPEQLAGAEHLTSPKQPADDMHDDAAVVRELFQRGKASWYGIQFHQKKTANGERFDMGAMTAAHKTLPFNTRVCVRSLVDSKEVMVRINDRGPYAGGRIIDLSRAAAEELGMIGRGVKQVALSIIDQEGMYCNGEAVGPKPLRTAALGGNVKSAVGRKRASVKRRKRR